MIPVLSAAEMREADRATIEGVGLPGAVLMENAGAAVVVAIEKRYPGARRPLVFCGKGMNGGDGFVAARRLRHRGAVAVLAGRRDEVKGDAALHLRAYERSGGLVLEGADERAWEDACARLLSTDLVIDALLGTGLEAEPRGLVKEAVPSCGKRGSAAFP
jgi:NAD(P)H-hydrate epimerase